VQPKLDLQFENVVLIAQNQIKVQQQVARNYEAAVVADQLLSVQVKHKRREADHAVQHIHDDYFINQLSFSLYIELYGTAPEIITSAMIENAFSMT
jgi:hypothetical protein